MALKEDIKVLLKINDTDIYDDELDILIPTAVEKARIEGAKMPSDIASDGAKKMYSVIIGYEVAKNIDIDLEMERLNEMYLTCVNTFRNKID